MDTGVKTSVGGGGIRTLDTGVSAYNRLIDPPHPLPIARNQTDTITSGAPSPAESGRSASVYAPPATALDHLGPLNRTPHLISCPIGELRPLPSNARHRLSLDACKLSALAERGDQAFCDPIVVTRDRIVIDGYARLELAKRNGISTLNCIVRDVSQEHALEELIRAHGPSRGLSDFVRIELALDLEPYFREKARANQETGGKHKGSSKLTLPHRIDTRREIAMLAGVSSGNVTKVKNILTHACLSLLEAVRIREVSIHRADKWSHGPHAQQKEYLRRRRIERGLKKTARNRVAEILTRLSSSAEQRQVIRFSELAKLLNDAGSIQVEIVDVPGAAVFVTRGLVDSLTPTQGVLVS
jgi:hypothetical protein